MYILAAMKRRNRSVGRPKIKGKPLLIKLRKDLRKYLDEESNASGKSMVRIMEELLDYRRAFKTFPPVTT